MMGRDIELERPRWLRRGDRRAVRIDKRVEECYSSHNVSDLSSFTTLDSILAPPSCPCTL